MRNQEREEWVIDMIRDVGPTGNVLTSLVGSSGQQGKAILAGAYTYVYAAMLADFLIQMREGDWIGPSVVMPDKSIKDSDEAVMDHLFETTLGPLFSRDGAPEFLAGVKWKAMRIVEAKKAKTA